MTARRLLYVDSGRSFGGAERVTLSLASSFASEGSAVGCAIDPSAEAFAAELRRRGIEAFPLPEADRLGRAGALAACVRRFAPDIVHIQRTWPLSDRYASLAARRGGARRVVATEHVRWERCGLRDRAAKMALARLDRTIVAVSDAVRESLVRYWRVDSGRVLLIPNGIDTRRFGAPAPIAASRSRPAGRGFRIGTIGRLEEQKGIDVLLDAFADIAREEPGAELVVAGDGSLRTDLERRASGLGLAGSVRFAGTIDDVAPLLASLDLFVLASRWEGLPLTLLEAMAAGVPIVATSVDGSAEAVRSGVDGLLVPPDDPGALARAILASLHDRAAAIERARAARGRASSIYSIERMVADYRRVYES